MGSGFRTFAASEVLTSSNVQNYLMTQSTMFFVSTTARDAAITSPVDGMVAYIGSNDSSEGLYTYNGTSWRKGPGWNAPWGFITSATTTSSVNANYANILTSTASVVNRRRYRITGQIPSFRSTDVRDVAGIAIVVGGAVIARQNVGCVLANSGNFGATVVCTYTATATNTSLAINLYNQPPLTYGTHTFDASATTPIMILTEDIGPSGAPV
jgi:hypothetical protein